MGSKIYVGNLSYNVTNADLTAMFEPHGAVTSAEVINDRESGRSKGFGFVQMGTDAEAASAIAALSGKEHDGRALTVNEAKPREDRPRSGSGGGYGGGGNRGSRDSGSSPGGSRGYVERGSTGGRSGNSDRDSGNRR
jgi:RNA recognition motif-containing protein